MTTVRWGVIGCGKISHDFCNVLLSHPRTRIVACAARSLSKSISFATKFNIENAYDSYHKVSENPQVDIIYIGTIHPTHYSTVITALNNNKHVLCEKPVAMNAYELQQMIAAAKRNNKFFLEGMMSRFFPAFRQARKWLNDGVIGDITAYFADYGRVFDSHDKLQRIWDKKLGAGSLLDIGCYAINPITYIFGERFPDKMVATATIDKKFGIDVQSSISFSFGEFGDENNPLQIGQISCNMFANTINEFRICGKKGQILFRYPAHKCTELVLYKYDDRGKDIISTEIKEFKLPQRKEFKYGFIFRRAESFVYQVDAVYDCLDKGLIECPEYTWNEMLFVMKFMDKVRQQIGLKYSADEKAKL